MLRWIMGTPPSTFIQRASCIWLPGQGTVLPGIGTVASVGSATINGGILNDSGQILFWATLVDGKGVLLLASSATTDVKK